MVRPDLVLGAERLPVLLLAMPCALSLATGNVVIIGYAVAFWIVGHCLLRALAKRDPQMTEALVRHFNVQTYYPPLPTLPTPPSIRRKHQR